MKRFVDHLPQPSGSEVEGGLAVGEDADDPGSLARISHMIRSSGLLSGMKCPGACSPAA
jgi:hypothetical protein